MYAFRHRPLTWLFLIALACLNVVALATDFRHDWYADLLAAQMYLAGGWLALGRTHRLARAGVFVAAILASVAPDYLAGSGEMSVWSYVLGSLIFLASVTAAACWLFLAVGRALRREPIALRRMWQFPLAEIFGWMILVAVVATVLPAATFRHLMQPPGDWIVPAATAVIAALLMTLFLRREPGHDLSSSGIAMVAVTAVFVLILRFDQSYDLALLRAYLPVGLWILVQRLDAQRLATMQAGGAAPATVKLYDPESDKRRQRLG
jgi:hypothetical protein